MTGSGLCIFTSAGDNNNVSVWRDTANASCWDLITAFYGDDEAEFAALAGVSTQIARAKGSKFQNLKSLVRTHRPWFENYRYIWVCDDDLIMRPEQIARAFELSQRLGAWVAQPAFDAKGKAPHPITHSQYPHCDARLVSFVEVTCPLFRADKLFDFLDVYDGELIGWGVDWWIAHHFRADENWRFAILDCVEITNPQPQQRRGRQREILKLGSNDERRAQWLAVQEKLQIPEVVQRTHARIKFATD